MKKMNIIFILALLFSQTVGLFGLNKNFEVAIELARTNKVEQTIKNINQIVKFTNAYILKTADLDVTKQKLQKFFDTSKILWKNAYNQDIVFKFDKDAKKIIFSNLLPANASDIQKRTLKNSMDFPKNSYLSDENNYTLEVYLDDLVSNFIDLVKKIGSLKQNGIEYIPTGDGGFIVKKDAKEIGKISINDKNSAIAVENESELQKIKAAKGSVGYVVKDNKAYKYIYNGTKWIGLVSKGGIKTLSECNAQNLGALRYSEEKHCTQFCSKEGWKCYAVKKVDPPKIESVKVIDSIWHIIKGTAQPNSKVTIYENKSELGNATADENGNFEVKFAKNFKPGSIHKLSAQTIIDNTKSKLVDAGTIIIGDKVAEDTKIIKTKDNLIGTDGIDTILAGGDDDTITPKAGNDYIDGGNGYDTVVLNGKQSDYTFEKQADGSYLVKKDNDTKILKGIEVAKFADGSIKEFVKSPMQIKVEEKTENIANFDGVKSFIDFGEKENILANKDNVEITATVKLNDMGIRNQGSMLISQWDWTAKQNYRNWIVGFTNGNLHLSTNGIPWEVAYKYPYVGDNKFHTIKIKKNGLITTISIDGKEVLSKKTSSKYIQQGKKEHLLIGAYENGDLGHFNGSVKNITIKSNGKILFDIDFNGINHFKEKSQNGYEGINHNVVIIGNKYYSITGKADPNSKVLVYENDTIIGEGQAGSDGEFVVNITKDFPVNSTHKLYIQAIKDGLESKKKEIGSVVVGDKVGQAVEFDGKDDYFKTKDEIPYNHKGFTYFIKLNRIGDIKYYKVAVDLIFQHKLLENWGDGLILALDKDANIKWGVIKGRKWDFQDILNYKILKNKTYNIAWSFDGKLHKLFVNGILIKTQNKGLSPIITKAPILLGAYSDGYNVGNYNSWLNAIVDNFQIYNRALNNDEIQKISNGKVIKDSSLVAYYDFEGKTWSEILKDKSGNGHNGVAYGNPKVVPFGKAPSKDKLIGTNLNDVLLAGGDDDTIYPKAGNDYIDGGDGYDTVVLSGYKSSYTITKNSDGTYTLKKGNETKILKGVEAIKFADGTWEIVKTPTIQSITKTKDKAASFDGKNWINTPAKVSSLMSFSIKIKTTSKSMMSLVDNFTNNYTQGISIFTNSDGKVYLASGGGNKTIKTSLSKTAINDNKLHHIVGVFDKINSIGKIYIDGILEVSEKFYQYDSEKELVVGKRGYVSDYYFNGQISDIQIYNKALTPDEVKIISNGGIADKDHLVAWYDFEGKYPYADKSGNGHNGINYGTTIVDGEDYYKVTGKAEPNAEVEVYVDGKLYTKTISDRYGNFIAKLFGLSEGYHKVKLRSVKGDIKSRFSSEKTIKVTKQTNNDSSSTTNHISGLVIEYKFDQNSKDTSGNNRDGSYKGSAKYIYDDQRKSYVLGLPGNNSSYFEGSNYDFVSNNKSFTVTVWVKPQKASRWARVFSKGQTNHQLDIIFENYGNSGRVWGSIANGDNTTSYTEAVDYGKGFGVWQHIALVRDAKNKRLKLYINGHLTTSHPYANKYMPTSGLVSEARNAPLQIGTRTNGWDYYRGMIDNFRVYNRALSESEIQQDMKIR